MSDLHLQPAHEIADAVRAGKLSAADVLEHHLERIEARNDETGAFVFLDPDRARAVAAGVDRRVAAGEHVGPLAGIPLGIKELEAVEGWPDTHASTAFADEIATYTTTSAARLLAADAVPVGLTASPELGLLPMTVSVLHGACRNPWNLDCNPGGSSGGAAAALAAGLVPLATGSDMGGSIRQPAGLCGVVGVKGTYGRVPRGPGYLGNQNLTHYGPLARTVRDAARYLDCVVGPDERDPFSLAAPPYRFEDAMTQVDLRGTRVAICSGNGIVEASSAVAEVVTEAAEALVSAAGLEVVGDARMTFPDTMAAHAVLALDSNPTTPIAAKMPEVLANFLQTPGVAAMLEIMGNALGPPTLESIGKANEIRWAIYDELARLFSIVDLICVPTTPLPSIPVEGPLPSVIDGVEAGPAAMAGFTHPFNYSGHPAVSVPAGIVDGVPVGMQIVARRHDDVRALAAAAAFEAARPWPLVAPAFSG